MTLRLYVWQRLSAVLMVPLIGVHLATIFYASGAQLSAAAILARTSGSVFWGGFYSLFVCAAAIHGAIGLRSVLADWSGLNPRRADQIMWLFGMTLLVLGLRGVAAVVVA